MCRHVEKVRVSSHDDLAVAVRDKELIVSTYSCDREKCLEQAKTWVRAQSLRDDVVVVRL